MAIVTKSKPLSAFIDAKAVTLHDTNKIGATRGLYVGTATGAAGTLKVTTAGETDVTLTGVLAGTVYDISVIRVWATGTTATNIVALY